MPSAASLKIAVVQFNATVGDLAGNAGRIAEAAREAHGLGARLVLTPELSLTGYPPEDLLLRPDLSVRVELALGEMLRGICMAKTKIVFTKARCRPCSTPLASCK